MDALNTAVRSFSIDVAHDVIEDLHQRLRATRFPESETVDDWSQGVPLAYAQELVSYWLNEYDWSTRQHYLNRFPQFKTNIDGLDIHFVHAQSPHPSARALVLTHGWPSSIAEFQEVIGPLIDPPNPDDAFHIVCPSLPGYGFSDKPGITGWGTEKIAAAWDTLMRRLGYDGYFAQGGDWGAAITTAIAVQNKGACQGIHTTVALANPPLDIGDNPQEEDMRAFLAVQKYQEWGEGYMKQQSTRPQTLGYGLSDSPVGQAMWVLEKFYEWTDCSGHIESIFTKDQLLDNIMCYWLTGSAASSARLYWENRAKTLLGAGDAPISLPFACSNFPKEILYIPKRWAETRFDNIVYWNEVDKGGHFAAFEQPELFVDEIRSAFRMMS